MVQYLIKDRGVVKNLRSLSKLFRIVIGKLHTHDTKVRQAPIFSSRRQTKTSTTKILLNCI